MKISYIDGEKIVNLNLPQRVWGNYWITDSEEVEEARNIVNIKAKQGQWQMMSNQETSIIYNNVGTPLVTLNLYTFYTLKESEKTTLSFIYTTKVFDETYETYNVQGECDLKIGKGNDSDIIYNNLNISEVNNTLTYRGTTWILKDLNSRFGTYVNNKRVKEAILNNGDIIFIMGLKIIVMGDKLLINNPLNSVTTNTHYLVLNKLVDEGEKVEVQDEEPGRVTLYSEEDYFIRSPRFRSHVQPAKIKIDSPPQKKEISNKPALLVIGPAITMSMMSLMQLLPALEKLQQGASFGSVAPRLLTSGAMLISSLVWPTLNRKYEKKQMQIAEAIRQKKYKQYIDAKYRQLLLVAQSQKDTLIDNNITLNECEKIILNKSHKLWERVPEHDDFLKVRLGLGNSLVNVEIDSDNQKFSLDSDSLINYMHEAIAKSKVMTDVPITESFRTNNIVAIEGKVDKTYNFMENLMLQFITFHSYKDLKIFVITDEKNKDRWEFTRSLPHCWSDDKETRFVATNSDEMKELSFYLEQVLKKRIPETNENERKLSEDEKRALALSKPYYLIITDNYKVARNLQMVQDVVNAPFNYGFSLIILGQNLSNVPANCKSFISLGEKQSGLFESQLLANKQKLFIPDTAKFDLEKCARKLANIPIELASGEYSLPSMVSFLQMYKAGMIDQLNPLARWKKNNPVVSLGVPVGVGTNGELFKLDLHEKYHGPHGLIAGMTGSGKSEFIISYVLSLAVNFSPEEVQFVLIDYKGGGLAGAFENRETGMSLPHLVGTITNLDGTEIQRSLLSIESELKRRQAKFNEARDKLNESTMDIYKYQKFYREGMLDEPISHLFLISDEFAELKAQEPEFMDELISTARIGRSLGVHLILATQKPSGVVNDQIWSNSRFRVCLKVQDASDSKEMIRRPDAAALKEAGRFYLQVGYDEYFALGQSAWCGAPYIPSEKVVQQIDDSLEFIDDTGNVIRTINNVKPENNKAQGEELLNILSFIIEVSEIENFKKERLWLERIPEHIFVNDLIKKYGYKSRPKFINPVIGEYDVPSAQKQYLLTLPLNEVGNTFLVSISGKDLFFQTLIYSLAISYSPEDVNIYALDFGTESLRSFMDIPHVGDVMVGSEEEKITNFFKMLDDEIEVRKRRLKAYHGDYKFFLEQSEESMPLIVVIFNNIEAFMEMYTQYEDKLRTLSRDSSKYGITLIVGASSESGIRTTTRQNFNERITMELNDAFAYRSILGVASKLQPSKGEARGLIRKGDFAHEFQTARMCPTEGVSKLIQSMGEELNKKYPNRAPRVPMLPDIVRIENLKDYHQDLRQFGVALDTDTLKPILYDFTAKVFTPIVSAFSDNLKDFTETFLKALSKVSNVSYQFWDGSREFKDLVDPNYYVYQNFKNVFEQLHPYLKENYKLLVDNNYNLASLDSAERIVIVANGFPDIFAAMNREEKIIANEVFKYAEETKLVFFVLVDGADVLRKARYDLWSQTYLDEKEGLYMGSNINDTMFFKLSTNPRSLRDRLANDYGYYIKKGIPIRCKFMSSRKGDDDGE